MEFRILGPLEIVHTGAPVPVGPPRIRTVLALLLLSPDSVVSVDRFVDEMWPEHAPARARGLVHDYLARLRRALPQRDGRVRLVTRRPGYLLAVEDGEVDLHNYERLLARARATADTRAGDRLASYREADRLWRGPAFADVRPTPAIAAVVTALAERRLAALEEQYEVALGLGPTAELVAELTPLVASHPHRERLVGQLMRAQHHTGRTADALATYRQTRERLADETGLDPGTELRGLERAILRGDLTQTRQAGPAAGGSDVLPKPAQLPADLAVFVGRADALARLLAAPSSSHGVVHTIDGMAGMGKTALAVHAAHRLSGAFPDGQLFIDLHGHTLGMAPVPATDALLHVLRGLGIPGQHIPTEPDQRAALYRTLMAEKRMLIVLDDAASEEQVQPLLPGARSCRVLVTSRRRLTGLDNASPLSIDVLSTDDAVALFAEIAGTDRTAAEAPELVRESVELCGRLPLAIRIAAARFRARPAWRLGHLADRLRDERARLTELAVGHRSVAVALGLSYQQLDPLHQRTYRLLGLHPGPDIDPHAVAALTDQDHARAVRQMDHLTEVNLLLEPVPGRHIFHSLARIHAADVVLAEPATERRAAVHRLFDYYADAASAIAWQAYPYEHGRHPRPTPAESSPTDPATAAAWLETELPNLLAVARYGAAHGWPGHTTRLAAALRRHLDVTARYVEAEPLHRVALDAARGSGDRAGELGALLALAQLFRMRNQHDEATAHLVPALAMARAEADAYGEVDALNGLGNLHRLRERHEEAIARFTQAADVAVSVGDQLGEADAYLGLGKAQDGLGHYPAAHHSFARALALADDIGYRKGQLDALVRSAYTHFFAHRDDAAAADLTRALGIAELTGDRAGELTARIAAGFLDRVRGRYDAAAAHYRRSLTLARAAGHRIGQVSAWVGLGNVLRRQGRHAEAFDNFGHALDLARAFPGRNWEYEVLQGLGRAQHAAGRPAQALDTHGRALGLAVEIEQLIDEARAHDGLAHAHAALGQRDLAGEHWRRALEILVANDWPRTEEEDVTPDSLRRNLAGLASVGGQTGRVPPPGSGAGLHLDDQLGDVAVVPDPGDDRIG